jgi:hypothetical protein
MGISVLWIVLDLTLTNGVTQLNVIVLPISLRLVEAAAHGIILNYSQPDIPEGPA